MYSRQRMENRFGLFSGVSAAGCATTQSGLLPPKELLATSKAIDLIYEGVKYSLNCCQAGPRLFTVASMPKGGDGGDGGGGGQGLVEAQCRPLADGGYLLVIAGKSQVRKR